MSKPARYHIIAAVILMAFSVESCFVARNYERPEMELPENFRTDNPIQDTAGLAAVPWRTLFTDSSLQLLIEEGLANNIDIRVAIQQLLVAEAYMKQGKYGYLPTLDARLRYNRQKLSGNSQFGNQFSTLNQYEISSTLSWEADIWGKIRSSRRAALATYLQSRAAHQAVKSRLVSNIASAYYQLIALDEQLRITVETVETRANSVETTKALKDAGSLTEVAVKQTEAQLYTAQSIVIDLKRDIRLLENTISLLIGSHGREISRGDLNEQQMTLPLVTGVPLQLLSNRPDVMASEFALINAFEITNVSRAAFYPSFTITASGGLQSLTLDKLFSGSSFFSSLGGGLLQPLLDGRRIRTQYEVSKAQHQQAALDFEYTLLNAGKEVSDALFSYAAATEKIGVKEKEFESYSLATDYSEVLLDNGIANYLEVLTARQNALSSSLDIVNARNGRLQAIVDLYAALGGGWE